MKTVFIIILVILCILALRKLTKKSKTELITHPLFAISKRGFLGFMIGDSIDFVWSRINHLSLMTKEEQDEHKKKAEIMEMIGGFFSNSIQVAKNKYEGIEHISLDFDNNNCLNSIMVYIQDKPNTTADAYMEEIRNKYANIIGEPNVLNRNDAYGWRLKDISIALFYHNNKILLHIHNKH